MHVVVGTWTSRHLKNLLPYYTLTDCIESSFDPHQKINKCIPNSDISYVPEHQCSSVDLQRDLLSDAMAYKVTRRLPRGSGSHLFKSTFKTLTMLFKTQNRNISNINHGRCDAHFHWQRRKSSSARALIFLSLSSFTMEEEFISQEVHALTLFSSWSSCCKCIRSYAIHQWGFT